MKKNKGQKSRDRIIEVAIKLLSEKGYANTSAQEIADICGISQTTIFYHFKNKKILFSEILNYVIQTNRNIFETLDVEQTDAFERLILLLKANIQWCWQYPEQTKIVLFLFSFAAADNEAKILATKTIDKGRELVMEQLQVINTLNDDKDPIAVNELAIIIQQYVNAVMFQMLAREDREQVLKSFNDNVRTYLNRLIFLKY
ncbi:MAG: AcrR family transcriptional regulator [Bacteriovoracaceae bacterium]